MVYCGLYPVENNQYTELRDALEKLRLNDASFEKTAKAAGLELEPGQHQGRTAESNEGKLGIPPGFLE